jgi:hypothetical protein
MNGEPTPTHIYISGPMRGIDGFNFPAFFEAERLLRQHFPDADICNPAREDCIRFRMQKCLSKDPTGLIAGRYLQHNPDHPFTEDDLRAALRTDLTYITTHCNLVVLLAGWENSKGARAEAATAEALGIPVVLAEGLGEVTVDGSTGDPVVVAPAPVSVALTVDNTTGLMTLSINAADGAATNKTVSFDVFRNGTRIATGLTPDLTTRQATYVDAPGHGVETTYVVRAFDSEGGYMDQSDGSVTVVN